MVRACACACVCVCVVECVRARLCVWALLCVRLSVCMFAATVCVGLWVAILTIRAQIPDNHARAP